ncbi:ribbon-helix-helix domain-containing protein [Isoptericola dokdonensis]|uniref:Ribbon-helix-helix protein, copG family n=1 Tax=Isoptericola dokdonensis DS-3 TaxID=1300344 RepID=A0A168EDS1_9MICO|nr:ribbon-helix-helix domain-containing protein [Isoptericola dokdonensis]ANC29917.1 Ribbon-helix-helix protein, copG family [Isoptericola dokdonensis DS-3]
MDSAFAPPAAHRDDGATAAWGHVGRVFAEAGYDLPALRKRRRGRPAAGDGPGKPVTVRFDEQTLTALRERAKQEGLANESEAIRAAVRAWAHVA